MTRCSVCGRAVPLRERAWRCACGGPISWFSDAVPEPGGSGPGPWRHAAGLPAVPPQHRITLGEAVTPLLHDRSGVTYKLESMSPTGSFKDRGACVLASCLRAEGIDRVTLDSSGNAGAAMAAYLAAAGIHATVFVPAHASPVKLRQIASYGATLEAVTGDRPEVTRRAQQAAEESGAYYASHLWSPHFVAGMRAFAFELWEQLRGEMPAQVVLPVGSGSLLLGAHNGFAALRRAGLLERVPRLFGIQAAACAPLAEAFSGSVEPSHRGRSIAEGIMVPQPPREREILAAVRAGHGALVRVEEPEIEDAWTSLARRGVLVEPTSAVAEAGVRRLLDGAAIEAGSATVVVLTGTGLKALAG